MRAKLIDLLERTIWTAVQTFCGTLLGTQIVVGKVGWEAVLVSAGVAAGVAACKVVAAQNFSSNGQGDAFPVKKA